VANSVFINNVSSYNGGAIFNNAGTLTVTDSSFSSNSASYRGGGIYNNAGSVTVANTTLELPGCTAIEPTARPANSAVPTGPFQEFPPFVVL
jgi:predicted outer membrane repeat protein